MEFSKDELVTGKVKDVLVIGGGDTGSDCIGTAHRQGCKSVTQIEIMPKPVEEMCIRDRYYHPNGYQGSGTYCFYG